MLSSWLVTCLLAAVFGIVFLLTQVREPADYDAVSFILALGEYDMAQHQPHPPGAPLYIAAGKALAWLGATPLDALTLLSTLGAVAFLGIWHRTFLMLVRPERALVATILLGATPALYLSASQPMSDTLAAAAFAGVQWQAMRFHFDRRPSAILLATLFAVLCISIRPQIGVFVSFAMFVIAILERVPMRLFLRAVALFSVLNLLWLVPTMAIQSGKSGGDWLAYFKLIALFFNVFSEISSSPILSDSVEVLAVGQRLLVHFSVFGYFAAGLSLWYPESIAQLLTTLGTTHTPIYADLPEWSLSGSVLLAFYVVGCSFALPHVLRILRRRDAQLLLALAACYVVTVLTLVPPHTRFYIPLLPLLVLLPVSFIGRSRMSHILLGAFCLVAAASLATVINDTRQAPPPPLALADEIARVSAESDGAVRALLDSNGRRHVAWLSPEVKQSARPPQSLEEFETWFANGGRVLVSSPEVVAQFREHVHVEFVGEYRRPLRTWMRHTGTTLYEVTPAYTMRASEERPKPSKSARVLQNTSATVPRPGDPVPF